MKVLSFVGFLIRRYPWHLFASLSLLTLVGLVEMASVFSLAPVIDFFAPWDSGHVSGITKKFAEVLGLLGVQATRLSFVVVFLSLVVSQCVFLVVGRYFILRTNYAVVRDLINDTFVASFHARWSFFVNTNKGVFLNTFSREINFVRDCLMALGVLMADGFRLVFYLIVPFCVSWQVTVMAMGLGFIFAIPLLFWGSLSYRLGRESTVTANRFMDLIQESFGAAKVILGFGNQERHIRAVDQTFDRHRRASIKSYIFRDITTKAYEPFGWFTIMLTMYLATQYLKVPVAELGLAGYALLRSVPLMGSIITKKNILSNFFPSYEQILNLKGSAQDQVQQTGKTRFEELKQGIELKGVRFSYPDREFALQEIHAVISKGKMTAFAGVSGSGKSTLIDLLIGFYELKEGTIEVDGLPLREYDIDSYRQRIGYVPQDAVLFNTTIRENLLWGDEHASEAEMIEACRMANAHGFIMETPEGYETVIGDRGVRLSGGQQQRIALARAILRKPELLILDEATSNLDSQSEVLIQQAIERIARETTVVVIAHRLSTIINADYIYVLDNGQIVDEGTFSDLISDRRSLEGIAQLQKLK